MPHCVQVAHWRYLYSTTQWPPSVRVAHATRTHQKPAHDAPPATHRQQQRQKLQLQQKLCQFRCPYWYHRCVVCAMQWKMAAKLSQGSDGARERLLAQMLEWQRCQLELQQPHALARGMQQRAALEQ